MADSQQHNKEHIHEQYLKIVEKLKGGRIFDHPVEIDDIETVVVAAYYAGRGDARNEVLDSLSDFFML